MIHKSEGNRKYLGKTKSPKDAVTHLQSIYDGKCRGIVLEKVKYLKDLKRLQGWETESAHHIYVVGNKGYIIGAYFVLDNNSVYAIQHNSKRTVFGKW